MPLPMRLPLTVVLSTITLAACAQTAPTAAPAAGQYAVGFGPSPQLPAPETSLIPTVHIAKAQGWANGACSTAPHNTAVPATAPSGQIQDLRTGKTLTPDQLLRQLAAAPRRRGGERAKFGGGAC